MIIKYNIVLCFILICAGFKRNNEVHLIPVISSSVITDNPPSPHNFFINILMVIYLKTLTSDNLYGIYQF